MDGREPLICIYPVVVTIFRFEPIPFIGQSVLVNFRVDVDLIISSSNLKSIQHKTNYIKEVYLFILIPKTLLLQKRITFNLTELLVFHDCLTKYIHNPAMAS